MDAASPIRIEELLVHDAWLRRLAPSLLRDPARAEDAVQDAWLAALRRPPRGRASLSAWLARATRRRAASADRAAATRAEHEALAFAEPGAAFGADEAALRAELAREVADAVLTLAEPYRTTLLLRFFDDLPPRAIARRTGRPVDTVRTHVARGLALVRERVDRRLGPRESWAPALVAFAGLGRGAKGASAASADAAAIASQPMRALAALTSAAPRVGLIALLAAGVVLWSARARRQPQDDRRATPGVGAVVPVDPIASDAAVHTTTATGEPRRLASAAADASQSSPEPPAATIHGVLLDPTGAPLPGLALHFRPSAMPRWSGPDGAWLERGMQPEDPPEEALRELRAHPDALERLLASVQHGPPLALVRAMVDGSYRLPRATTAADGAFTLTSMEAADGEVVLDDPTRILVVRGAVGPDRTDGRLLFVACAARRVSGRVVDERGAPIADAWIGWAASGESLPAFAPRAHFTGSVERRGDLDDGGRFSLDVPAACGATLAAGAVGRGSVERRIDALLEEEVVLVLPPAPRDPVLAGVVLDRVGRPVAGARIGFGDSGDHAESDAQGRFDLRVARDPDPDDVLIAFARGVGRAVVHGLAADVRERGDVRDLVVSLTDPPRSIAGRVVDADGVPIAGVRIEPFDRTGYGGAWDGVEGAMGSGDVTDAEGRFRVGELGSGPHRLVCHRAEPFLWLLSEPIEAGSDGALVRVPADAMRELEGRVVDRIGRPVADVVVAVELPRWTMGSSIASRFGAQSTTDAEGRFRLDPVPRRGVRIVVRDPAAASLLDASFPIEDLATGEVELVAPRLVRFRLELDASDPARAFRLVDAAGAPVRATAIEARSHSIHDRVPRAASGAFPVCETSDAAAELVLYRGDEVLRRVAFEVESGGVGLLVLRL